MAKGGARTGAGRKPGVPNKASAQLKDLARKYTSDALETLAGIMTDVEETGSARVAAANAILDRGFGKPTQKVGGDDDNPITVVTRIILEAGKG